MALGPVVLLDLFVIREYVGMLLLVTHIIFTYFRFFLRELYFEKATRFCREVLMFLPSVWLSLFFSSSMNRFIVPFVPSGTT